MKVSVFTPSHDPRYLDECHASLRRQTHQDWEWVVLLNGPARWTPATPDARVRVERGGDGALVGEHKRSACALAVGEVLVELDHDDVLTPTCLADVVAAFEGHPEVVLVYSDFAQVDAEGKPDDTQFNTANGWQYEPVTIDGTRYLRCLAMEPTPHNVSLIWYAPNHVRAFRRAAYEKVGGYDASLAVLDDQDLMMRLFEVGDFHRIPKCLYLQRMHLANTQRDARLNAQIQAETVERYHAGIGRVAVAWAQRRGLAVIDVRTPTSPGRTRLEGSTDLAIDPERPALPYDDGSVGVVAATEQLQRIAATERFFAECHRVLAPGGLLLTMTPSTDGRGAFQDPTHVTWWNENSFWYLTQAHLRDRVYPGLRGARFQIGAVRTHFPTEFDRVANISYVSAHLIAVKDGPRDGGPLLS